MAVARQHFRRRNWWLAQRRQYSNERATMSIFSKQHKVMQQEVETNALVECNNQPNIAGAMGRNDES
jgi:hypothetical protein